MEELLGNTYYPFLGLIKHYNSGKNVKELDKITPKFSYLSGCSIFTDYSNIYKLEGFDERFFLYAEDLDLCTRAKQKGIKMIWCKNAIVYHKGGNSIGTKNIIRKRSIFSEYNSDYALLIYNKKYFKLHKLYSFNRYILKRIKFIIDNDKEMIEPLKKAYHDFFNNK